MAIPNSSISEIVTTTLRERSGRLADNVTDNTALFRRLKQRGNVRPFSGGRTIMEELFYAENSTFQRYSGYEQLNVGPSDVITSAEFEIKQAAVAVSMSGLEELQNAGDNQVIDLLEARITNAEDTFVNNLSSDMYSAGTADSGKQMGGLQLLVADNGVGTVGGINASTWAFWANYFYDFSVGQGSGAITPSATTIQAAMNATFLNTQRNRDMVDLIVADNVYFTYYWSSLQTIQRITTESRGAAGFQALQFMGADVIADGGIGGDAPSSHMYFLNTKYLFYRPHSARNMVVLSPDRYATNQDAFVRLIGWAGNMTTTGRQFQGVICA